MKVALNEKQKQLRGLSFSINIANFEAFLLVFKLTKNFLFLKSELQAQFFQKKAVDFPIIALFYISAHYIIYKYVALLCMPNCDQMFK